MKNKKVKWNNGDLFLIPLRNNSGALGQVLDLQMVNIVRCAIYEDVIPMKHDYDIINLKLNMDKLISLVACTREQLDFNVWKVIGNSNIFVSNNNYPNEKFRNKDWVGAIHYDASVIEDFVNAYHLCLPWDDWADPNFLDELLISKSKKPKNLIYK